MQESDKTLLDLELDHNDQQENTALESICTAATTTLTILVLMVFGVAIADAVMRTIVQFGRNLADVPTGEYAKIDFSENSTLVVALLFMVRTLNLGLACRYGFFFMRTPFTLKHPHVATVILPALFVSTVSAGLCPLSVIGAPLCQWLCETPPKNMLTVLVYTVFCGDRHYAFIAIESMAVLCVAGVGYKYVSANEEMNALLASNQDMRGVMCYLVLFVDSAWRKFLVLMAALWREFLVLVSALWHVCLVLIAAVLVLLFTAIFIGGHDFLMACTNWLSSGRSVPK